jgi:protein tyrosine phosphatase (PTP) superfamily phosphohydrolase (DUF442 family)
MNWNTWKTVWGYLASLFGKYTGLKAGGDSLDDIYNYVQISEHYGTSGQPTEKQFQLIKAAGFNRVINLAPADAENSLKDETALLSGLDMEYIHIPVNFVKPEEAKFKAFVEQMQANSHEKIWVHCAANMRVSAFTYRYRTEILGEDKSSAQQDLDKIWEPFGAWKAFMSRAGE